MSTPISFWKHHLVSDQKGEILAKETIATQQKFNFDLVKITPAGSWLATCYGVKDEFQNDFLGRRNITQRIIHNIDDWLSLKTFNSTPQPLQEQLLAATITCKAISNKPIYATVFCPLTQAFQCAGLDTLKKHWKEDKTKVLKGLEIITRNTIDVLRLFKNEGIRGMYFVTQSMQESVFTKEEYDELGKPFDAICLRECSSLFENTIFHLHGEKIYFSIEQNIPKVQLHYGLSENNFRFSEIKKHTQYNVIPGIPATGIIAANTLEKIQELVHKISEGENINMISCACVLPLDTSDEVIHLWKKWVKC
ncbi:MAG: uroporphyrinogen decarboxylase family protein [Flavobacteriales bacterium]